MKRIKHIYLSLLVVMLAFIGAAHAANACDWEAFASAPDADGYAACTAEVSESITGLASGKYKGQSSPAFLGINKGNASQALLDQLAQGNVYAEHLVAEAYPILESNPALKRKFASALGSMIKSDPAYYLVIMGRLGDAYDKHSYDEIATATEGAPDEAAELNQRLSALKGANGGNYAALKDRIISKLEDRLGRVK